MKQPVNLNRSGNHKGYIIIVYQIVIKSCSIGGELPKRHVQESHDGKTQHGSDSSDIGAFIALAFGDELLHHHVDHGTGGEAERVRQDGAHGNHSQRAQHRGKWLHQPGSLSEHESAAAREAFTPQGQRHRHALGEVLQPDAQGQRNGGGEAGGRNGGRHSAETHANRQTLRDVVQGDGQHQQDGALPVGLDPFGLVRGQTGVQVGQDLIDGVEECAAGEETRHRGQPAGDAAGLGQVPVVAGGIIPPEDVLVLKQLGVAQVYTPKDFDLNRIMSDLVRLIDARAGEEAA